MTRTLDVCWLFVTSALIACAEPSAFAEHEMPSPHDASSAVVQEASSPALDAAPAGTQTDAQTPAVDALDAGGEPSAADASVPDAQVPVAIARTPLVLAERWQMIDAGADPFQDRPAMVDCSTAGVVAETLSDERVLGVETGWCNYLTAQQPSQRAVQPGEVIKVRLWHFELSAPEPAEAHAAVQVGDLRVLDERIAIPQPGDLIVKQFTVDRAIPAGTPVHFHLHNHGANSWALVEVSAGPAAPK